jgi:hypothetical protein
MPPHSFKQNIGLVDEWPFCRGSDIAAPNLFMCVVCHFPEDDGVVVDLITKGIMHDSVPGQEYLSLMQSPIAAEVPCRPFGDARENPCAERIQPALPSSVRRLFLGFWHGRLAKSTGIGLLFMRFATKQRPVSQSISQKSNWWTDVAAKWRLYSGHNRQASSFADASQLAQTMTDTARTPGWRSNSLT